MPNKIIVILGPTASGKSELAVKLSLWLDLSRIKKYFKTEGAEIISADSRQIYKKMDIGSGKITKKEMKGIPHHLLSVVSPKKKFTVAQYQKLSQKKINEIFKKNKIPVFCGGTGFYIQAAVEGIIIPEVPPDWKMRKYLAKKSVEELYEILKKIDPKRAKTVEIKNPRRLIRAIEIAKKIGRVPILTKKSPPYPVLMIGIKKEREKLSSLIKKRLSARIKKGMVYEVKNLKKSGLSWKRMEEFGLEYRYVAQYIQKKIKYNEMKEKIQKESEHYAGRQMTWFKKNKKIRWVKNLTEAKKIIKKFLSF